MFSARKNSHRAVGRFEIAQRLNGLVRAGKSIRADAEINSEMVAAPRGFRPGSIFDSSDASESLARGAALNKNLHRMSKRIRLGDRVSSFLREPVCCIALPSFGDVAVSGQTAKSPTKLEVSCRTT
jgi:hypothetical protein